MAEGTGAGQSRAAAWAAVLLLIVGLAVAPPWRPAGELPEGFAARLADGDLEREDADGWATVRSGELVRDGSRVRSADGAALIVSGGRVMLAAGTRAVLDETVALEEGSLLTEVDGRDRAVRLGALVASGRGTWRADAGPAQRIAVYAGGVAVRPVDGEGGTALRRFEQVDLLAGRLPGRVLPLRYRSDDPWDARLLAGVIAVDREVERLQGALTGAYGEEPRALGFYARFAPGSGGSNSERLDPRVLERLPGALAAGPGDTLGPPSDVIVHLTIVGLLVARTPLDAVDAATEVQRLRRDGATWGIVLARHDLGVEDLRAAIDLVLDAPAPPEGATGPPPDATDEEGDGAAGGDGEGSGPGQGSGDGSDAGSGDDTGDGPDSGDDGGDDGSDGDGSGDGDEDAVDQLTDTVEETVDDVGDDLDDLVDELDDELEGDLGDTTATLH